MRLLQAWVAAALGLSACERGRPVGAEAAYQVASTPVPIKAAYVAPQSPPPSPADFVKLAGASDAFEVAAGQMAQSRARSPAVRQFAAVMVADHSRSSADLNAAIARSGQSLSPPSGLGDKQAALDRLGRADPKAFDRAYMDGQVRAHEQALALLQTYAQDGDVPALAAAASQALGMVQGHLSEARRVAEQLP